MKRLPVEAVRWKAAEIAALLAEIDEHDNHDGDGFTAHYEPEVRRLEGALTALRWFLDGGPFDAAHMGAWLRSTWGEHLADLNEGDVRR